VVPGVVTELEGRVMAALRWVDQARGLFRARLGAAFTSSRQVLGPSRPQHLVPLPATDRQVVHVPRPVLRRRGGRGRKSNKTLAAQAAAAAATATAAAVAAAETGTVGDAVKAEEAATAATAAAAAAEATEAGAVAMEVEAPSVPPLAAPVREVSVQSVVAPSPAMADERADAPPAGADAAVADAPNEGRTEPGASDAADAGEPTKKEGAAVRAALARVRKRRRRTDAACPHTQEDGEVQRKRRRMSEWDREIQPDVDATLYCLCRRPLLDSENGGMMVACESCHGWFHGVCVNLTQQEANKSGDYVCADCCLEAGRAYRFRDKLPPVPAPVRELTGKKIKAVSVYTTRVREGLCWPFSSRGCRNRRDPTSPSCARCSATPRRLFAVRSARTWSTSLS
jgi:hypothetical protein